MKERERLDRELTMLSAFEDDKLFINSDGEPVSLIVAFVSG